MTVDLEDVDFEQLTVGRDIDVCKLIEDMNKQGITRALYFYARDIVKGRWPEAEPYIMEDPEWAHWYACNVIRGRWPLGSLIIWWLVDMLLTLSKGSGPRLSPILLRIHNWLIVMLLMLSEKDGRKQSAT